MLKFLTLLCLAFAIICEAQSKTTKKQKKQMVPTVQVVKMTSHEINSESNILKDIEDGLLQWQEEVMAGENGIMMYEMIPGKEYELEDLCMNKPQTIFPAAVKQFLGIKSCPIKKGTLTYLTNIFTKPNERQEGRCDDDRHIDLILKTKKDGKEIMRLGMDFGDRRLDECKSD